MKSDDLNALLGPQPGEKCLKCAGAGLQVRATWVIHTPAAGVFIRTPLCEPCRATWESWRDLVYRLPQVAGQDPEAEPTGGDA